MSIPLLKVELGGYLGSRSSRSFIDMFLNHLKQNNIMYKINEEEAWRAAAHDFLYHAYKFLENKLPEELLANLNPKKVTLYFWDNYLRPGSMYYKPDTNQIVVPKDVKINEIKGEEKSILISLFVHELMHAVFQNYLNKETMENKIEKSEKGKYITSDSSITLLSEGISYIFENLYLLYDDKFILSKGEIIDRIEKKIQDKKLEINRQKLDRNTQGMQQFEIFKIIGEVLSKTKEELSSLGIPSYPPSKDQLLAADLLLNEYKESNFDDIGKFISWVIKNHEQEAEKLAGDIAGLVRK